MRHYEVKGDTTFLESIGDVGVVVDSGSNAKPANETDAAPLFHAKV